MTSNALHVVSYHHDNSFAEEGKFLEVEAKGLRGTTRGMSTDDRPVGAS